MDQNSDRKDFEEEELDQNEHELDENGRDEIEQDEFEEDGLEPEEHEEDLVEEMAEDLRRSQAEANAAPPTISWDALTNFGKSIVLGGAGLIVLVLVLLIYIAGGGDGASSDDVASIMDRIDRIENRLAQIEGIDQKISRLEGQMAGFQQSISKLDKTGSSTKRKLDRLAGRVERLRKGSTSAPSRGAAASSQSGKQYHVVQRGETPFAISKKYGITLNELYRLNNLNKNKKIYPGQKLLVTP